MTRKNMITSDNRHIKLSIVRKHTVKEVHDIICGNDITNEISMEVEVTRGLIKMKQNNVD